MKKYIFFLCVFILVSFTQQMYCSHGSIINQVIPGYIPSTPFSDLTISISYDDNTGSDSCATVSGTLNGKSVKFYTSLSTSTCNSILPTTLTIASKTINVQSISCCNTEDCNTYPDLKNCYYGVIAETITGLDPITPYLVLAKDAPDSLGVHYCAVISGTFNSKPVTYYNWVNYNYCKSAPVSVPFNGVTISVDSILCCNSDGCNIPPGFTTTTSTTTSTISSTTTKTDAVSLTTQKSLTVSSNSNSNSNTSPKNSFNRLTVNSYVLLSYFILSLSLK